MVYLNIFHYFQWLKSLVTLQCDIANEITKASMPQKEASGNTVSQKPEVKLERKATQSPDKEKEKGEGEHSEISLETNEKMMIDDDLEAGNHNKNTRLETSAFHVLACFCFTAQVAVERYLYFGTEAYRNRFDVMLLLSADA